MRLQLHFRPSFGPVPAACPQPGTGSSGFKFMAIPTTPPLYTPPMGSAPRRVSPVLIKRKNPASTYETISHTS